jgi:hypothetical protein
MITGPESALFYERTHNIHRNTALVKKKMSMLRKSPPTPKHRAQHEQRYGVPVP